MAITLKQLARKLKGTVQHTSGEHFDGKPGLWSQQPGRPVKIGWVSAQINPPLDPGDKEEQFLMVYFEPRTWDIDRDGLIYTDQGWIKELRETAKQLGFERADELDYTEQGMQGEDYVHLIVGQW